MTKSKIENVSAVPTRKQEIVVTNERTLLKSRARTISVRIATAVLKKRGGSGMIQLKRRTEIVTVMIVLDPDIGSVPGLRKRRKRKSAIVLVLDQKKKKKKQDHVLKTE